ncbi:MAG: hypothetical protein ACJAQT_004823 [Akkermansiaceae bacterium]
MIGFERLPLEELDERAKNGLECPCTILKNPGVLARGFGMSVGLTY